ncbi:MAG: methyltransferase domain-containing protein [Caulobacteraceae bacterium]|nr:methyltransferase domain-containing protein [Caulobacteraceae bacterium]
MEIKKLNIGCGNDKREGYINLDIEPVGDVQRDIKRGLPFNDDSFDEVLVNNVLTQIASNEDFLFVMNEMWRVTKPEGAILVRVPLASDICSFQDPMDNRRFTEESFTYMEWQHRRYVQYGRHYGFKPFKVLLRSNNGKQMEFRLKPIKI